MRLNKYCLLLIACFLLVVEIKAQDNLKVREVELIAQKDKYGEWKVSVSEQKNFKKYFSMKDVGKDFLIVTDKKSKMPYTGIIKVLFPSGGTFCIWTYLDGLMNGNQRMYYENGNLDNEGFMSDGKLNGKFILYYEDGTPMSYETYKDDLQDGLTIQYYRDGTKKTEGNSFEIIDKELYGDSRPRKFYTGHWIYYYKNGKVECEGSYSYDKVDVESFKTGVWKYYDENGTFLNMKTYERGKSE